MEILGGAPAPLGASLADGGTNVAIWAPRASAVSLCLFDDDGVETTLALPGRTDGVWHGLVPGVGAGQLYGFRVDGHHDVLDGARFDADAVLLDPYAKAVVGGIEDSASTMRGVVVDETFDWQDDAAPRVPWERTVVYETHVRGLTVTHPDVPEELRGTYAGLAHPAVLDHLTGLGVTTVELLPVHHFATEPHAAARGVQNYWGYNTAGFLAPHGPFSSSGDRGEQVVEFKQMVRALHARGLEVVLDVVYNHTCEGGPDGPLVHLRGLDDGAYYRQADGEYLDSTGCGNTINVSFEAVADLVLDSLRYWVTDMHVDGFRFDLASALARGRHHDVRVAGSLLERIADDPVLRDVKLIAEPWDVTAEGYLVGACPTGWSEWNDRFRDDVRDFWRGAGGGVSALASRVAGSSEVYEPTGRGPRASVNFVTAHDGFTLRDLVSYDDKHNEANGEDNRDGSGDNHSWNCGVEGETDHPEVLELRRRQSRNLMATLLLSAGVPMIAHGDELGRTQGGNNNAYCQDNEVAWVDWSVDPDWSHLAPLVRDLARLRTEHPLLSPAAFFTGEEFAPGRRDLGWWHPAGRELTEADWHDKDLRSLAMALDQPEGEALLVLWHAGADPQTWTLPPTFAGRRVDVLLDTAEPRSSVVGTRDGQVVVSARSVVVLAATPA
ncbi:glycogen debranching protein GlgX [Solicola sp. PLA-1-18]|uniref:glycogen debranching protein GlgX n=1 Tax=Solicola sp. PLA-1-18 TaxID=3380532 RepID=UPI003B79FD98